MKNCWKNFDKISVGITQKPAVVIPGRIDGEMPFKNSRGVAVRISEKMCSIILIDIPGVMSD